MAAVIALNRMAGPLKLASAKAAQSAPVDKLSEQENTSQETPDQEVVGCDATQPPEDSGVSQCRQS